MESGDNANTCSLCLRGKMGTVCRRMWEFFPDCHVSEHQVIIVLPVGEVLHVSTKTDATKMYEHYSYGRGNGENTARFTRGHFIRIV